jgi:hypothetical protein
MNDFDRSLTDSEPVNANMLGVGPIAHELIARIAALTEGLDDNPDEVIEGDVEL